MFSRNIVALQRSSQQDIEKLRANKNSIVKIARKFARRRRRRRRLSYLIFAKQMIFVRFISYKLYAMHPYAIVSCILIEIEIFLHEIEKK